MARQSAEEKQILDLLQQIKSNGKTGKDINKALGLFKKSQKLLNDAIAMLEDDSASDVDPEAPYGRKADGTPKQKGGRRKADTSVLDTAGAAEDTTTDGGAITKRSKK